MPQFDTVKNVLIIILLLLLGIIVSTAGPSSSLDLVLIEEGFADQLELFVAFIQSPNNTLGPCENVKLTQIIMDLSYSHNLLISHLHDMQSHQSFLSIVNCSDEVTRAERAIAACSSHQNEFTKLCLENSKKEAIPMTTAQCNAMGLSNLSVYAEIANAGLRADALRVASEAADALRVASEAADALRVASEAADALRVASEAADALRVASEADALRVASEAASVSWWRFW